jgi:hypothetical protein
MNQVLLFALALAGASGAVLAEPLAVQESGNVQFVTGGVGDDERFAFDELRKAFNLELVFAAKGGAYVADVDIVIQDKSGREVLRTRAEGPRLLARLPQGAYKVTASYDGVPQVRSFAVPGRGTRQIALYWTDPSVAEQRDTQPERSSRGGSR